MAQNASDSKTGDMKWFCELTGLENFQAARYCRKKLVPGAFIPQTGTRGSKWYFRKELTRAWWDKVVTPQNDNWASENGLSIWEILVMWNPRLLRFNPSAFRDVCAAFALARHKTCELKLCHAHGIAPMLHKPVAQIWRRQSARDVFR